MTTGRTNDASREQEIAYISRGLKALAKDLDVPVIALSQLSRQVEQRGGDKRPQLSDLRESGSIEQDADVVCFLYRPEYYKIMQIDGMSTAGLAEIIIGKQRNGPVGSVQVHFISQYARFENLMHVDPDDVSMMPPPHIGETDIKNLNARFNKPSNYIPNDDAPF
jgi:replicative DNA helicase